MGVRKGGGETEVLNSELGWEAEVKKVGRRVEECVALEVSKTLSVGGEWETQEIEGE